MNLEKILNMGYGTRTPLEQCISDAVTLEDEHDGDYTQIEQAVKALSSLLEVGDRMSNMLFNYAQMNNSFTPAERKLMKELQEQWDVAIKACVSSL